MEFGMVGLGIVGLALGLYGFVVILAIVWTRRGMARERARYEADPFRPPLTILKPLKGVDEDLEANLDSFASLQWPELQILFGIADEDDPAVAVARRIQERYPEKDIEVIVDGSTIGRNPKVNQLHNLLPHAKHELVLISDSNVRAYPGYLEATVLPMRDPAVGLVSNPVIGDGEETVAAAMENLHLVTFAACIAIAGKVVTGIDAVVGKSMLMRKAAIEAVGGFVAFRNILAEDQLIAKRLPDTGWKVVMVAHPVRNINRHWSLRRLIQRHARWAKIRTRMVLWSYPLELFANPIALALLAALFGATGGAALVLGTVAAKIALDAMAAWGLRGRLPRLHYLLAIPVKDLIIFGIWFVPAFSSEVEWRGHRLRITAGTRLVSADALSRAQSIARLSRRSRRDAGDAI